MTNEQTIGYILLAFGVLITVGLIIEGVTKTIAAYKRMGFWRFLLNSILFIIYIPIAILAWILSSGGSSSKSSSAKNRWVPVISEVGGMSNVNIMHLSGNDYIITCTTSDGQPYSTRISNGTQAIYCGSDYVQLRWT